MSNGFSFTLFHFLVFSGLLSVPVSLDFFRVFSLMTEVSAPIRLTPSSDRQSRGAYILLA